MSEEKGVITLEIGPNVKELAMAVLNALLKTKGFDPIVKEPETKVKHAIGDCACFNRQACPKCGGPLFESKTGFHCVNGDYTLPTDAELTDIAIAVVNEPDTTPPPAETAANVLPPELPPVEPEDTWSAVQTTSTQAPPTPPPADTTVELADGIPHDIRIHASTRTKYAKPPHGWKLKRGVDPALVETVTAELRAAMAIPATPPAPPATPPAPPATPPAPPATPPAPPATPPAPPAAITTFAEFVAAMTPAMASGQLTQAIIDAELAAIGLNSVALLGARQDLIPALAAKLFPGGVNNGTIPF